MVAFADEELAQVGELDDEIRAAILEVLDQARRGEFASEEEIAAVWRRLGL